VVVRHAFRNGYFSITPLPEPSVAALLVPAIILMLRRRHNAQPNELDPERE